MTSSAFDTRQFLADEDDANAERLISAHLAYGRVAGTFRLHLEEQHLIESRY